MTDQLDLFTTGQVRSHIDPAAAVAARDGAIAGAARAVDLAPLERIVLDVARTGREFTTDDIWAALGDDAERITEPRVLGAVMRQLAKSNRITGTGSYRNSARPACHARPVKVWRAVKPMEALDE